MSNDENKSTSAHGFVKQPSDIPSAAEFRVGDGYASTIHERIERGEAIPSHLFSSVKR